MNPQQRLSIVIPARLFALFTAAGGPPCTPTRSRPPVKRYGVVAG